MTLRECILTLIFYTVMVYSAYSKETHVTRVECLCVTLCSSSVFDDTWLSNSDLTNYSEDRLDNALTILAVCFYLSSNHSFYLAVIN